MFPEKVQFDLFERRNTFEKSGKEWALNVRFDGGNWWTLTTWSEKPSVGKIAKAKEVALRSFEVYFRAIQKPSYTMEVEG